MASSETFDPAAAAKTPGLGDTSETRLVEDLRLERVPWMLALALLLVAALAAARRTKASASVRCRPSDRATAGDEP